MQASQSECYLNLNLIVVTAHNCEVHINRHQDINEQSEAVKHIKKPGSHFLMGRFGYCLFMVKTINH